MKLSNAESTALEPPANGAPGILAPLQNAKVRRFAGHAQKEAFTRHKNRPIAPEKRLVNLYLSSYMPNSFIPSWGYSSLQLL